MSICTPDGSCAKSRQRSLSIHLCTVSSIFPARSSKYNSEFPHVDMPTLQGVCFRVLISLGAGAVNRNRQPGNAGASCTSIVCGNRGAIQVASISKYSPKRSKCNRMPAEAGFGTVLFCSVDNTDYRSWMSEQALISERDKVYGTSFWYYPSDAMMTTPQLYFKDKSSTETTQGASSG